MKYLACIFAVLSIVAVIHIESTLAETSTTNSTTTSDPTDCDQYTDCDGCVSKSKGNCVFCNDIKKCRRMFTKDFFHAGKVCPSLMNASWGTCAVNILALIIGMSVVGGVLIISVCACICCCCCCKDSAKQKLKWLRQDQASERRTEERKAQYAERRAERQAKNDEIRKKYGLFKDDQGGYQRMDNEA